MNMQEVYDILAHFPFLSDDDKQEVAIKVWSNRQGFETSKGSLYSYVASAAHNFNTSNKRKKNYLTKPISYYDSADGSANYIVDFLPSDELSALDGMIESENIEVLLEELKMLPMVMRETFFRLMDDSYSGVTSTERVNLMRLRGIVREIIEKNGI